MLQRLRIDSAVAASNTRFDWPVPVVPKEEAAISQSNVIGDNRQVENAKYQKMLYFLHLQITSVAENVGVT